MIDLIIGGARSGKSRIAEARALHLYHDQAGQYSKLIYLATAQSADQEMARRIALHQQQRAEHWQLIEEPWQLARVLSEHNHRDSIILLECLTLWLSNLLCHPDPKLFDQEKQQFLQQLQNSQARIIIVSNETGLGVVPMGQLTRRFVDESGFLHQQIAQISEQVSLVIAGLEHPLKTADKEL